MFIIISNDTSQSEFTFEKDLTIAMGRFKADLSSLRTSDDNWYIGIFQITQLDKLNVVISQEISVEGALLIDQVENLN